MMFSPLVWALFSFTLMVALPGALASPSPKRTARKNTATRVTVETYPAMEDGEIVAPMPTRVTAIEPAALPKPESKREFKAERLKIDSLRIGQSAPISVPTEEKAPIANTTFEVVPTEKRGQILKRMQICAELLRTTGRAYDYRALTTADLEKELQSVRVNSSVANN